MMLQKIIKSFFSLSAITLLSRISGFAKVAGIASIFGRASYADVLTAVMILPDLVYKFLSEGLISGAAVPIFVKHKDDKDTLNKAFWSIFWITAAVSLIISIGLAIGTNSICELIMPNIDQLYESTLRRMWLILIPYLMLGMLSGVQTSLLNAKLSFAKPAIGPVLVNLSIIAVLPIATKDGIEIIAIANTIGALIQCIWLALLIRWDDSLGVSAKKCFVWDKEIVTDFIKASAPVVVWISILPLIPVYERHLLAADQGAIATLNYTEKLFNLPLGIISISLAYVILPNLSRLEGKERTEFLMKALGMASLAIAPIVAIMWFGADLIVEIVYMRGNFLADDAMVAASLFKVYGLALLPVSLNMILNRGFFAASNFMIPFAAGLLATLLQLHVCNIAVSQYGIRGVAIAAISAGFLQLIVLLLFSFRKKQK